MQVKIDSVSDVKTNEHGTSSKIKCGNEQYYINEDGTPLVGKTVEIGVVEKTSQAGRKYKIATIQKILGAETSSSSNGHIAWADYEQMAKLAHELALQLEPDGTVAGEDQTETGEAHTTRFITVDRSTARAAILNTVMIAFSNGKISLTAQDDDIPF